MIYRSIDQMIGNTPLLHATRMEQHYGACANLYCKIESKNPAGSVKDRTALYLLNDAEERGLLSPGATVIEPTSGNTGIGLAALCAARGYRLVLTMPDTMSVERQKLLAAYGAEICLTPGKEGMTGAIRRAEEIAAATEGSFLPSQFDNPANPRAHYETTGPELLSDLAGEIDAFVAGVGTGGTLTGTGRYLKENAPACRVVAVEPAASPLLSEGRAGAHGLQGIGANFVPANYDPAVTDEVISVTEEDAYRAARAFATKEGLLVGISAGAALHAARLVACREEMRGKNVVVLLPDLGDHYLSTALFGE